MDFRAVTTECVAVAIAIDGPFSGGDFDSPKRLMTTGFLDGDTSLPEDGGSVD